MLVTLVKAAAIGIGALLALKLLVVWIEPRMAFHPSRGLSLRPSDRGVPYQEHRIRTSDGEELVAWEMTVDDPLAEVIFFHGNAGNLSSWFELLEQIRRQRVRLLALDYRGYGDSSGSPSEQGLYRDVDAFLEVFDERIHQTDLPVVYWGRSLGGPVAGYAASRREPDGLILEATFPSKASLMDDFLIFKVLNPLSRYEFPTARFLQERRCPTLVIHGDRDGVISFRQGERLFESLAEPKQFYRVSGAGHNDTDQVAGEEYWKRIGGLIRESKGFTQRRRGAERGR